MQVPVCEQECLLRPSICTSDHLGCCLEGQFGSGRVDISMNKTVVLHMVRGSCGVGDVPGCTTECWCRASGTWCACGACACCCLRRVFVCWFVLRVGVYAWYAAPLAQLVERQSHNLKVASSILAGSNPFMPIEVVSCLLQLAPASLRARSLLTARC